MRSNLTSYWDHTEQERAALSDDEMQVLETLELMEQGIIVPAVPKYEELESVDIPKKTMYQLLYNDSRFNRIDIKFDTSEQAEAAAEILRLGFTIQDEYPTDCAVANPIESVTVGTIEVAEKDAVTRAKEVLTENKSRKTRNSTLHSDYDKAITKRTEALNSIHTDRWSQREELSRCHKIHETWLLYLETCDGAEMIALKFLLKAYTIEDIEQMNLWLEIKVPTTVVKEMNDAD